jgi:predicted transposase/invertase (TIGR01784 family)
VDLHRINHLLSYKTDDPVDRWLSFLAEPEKILTMPKFDLSVYPNLLKAAELLDESNYTQEQLNAYDRHLLAVYDINMSRIESFDEGVEVGETRGVAKGLKQGLEQGRVEGREEGREEGIHLSVPIIKELLKGELSHEEIAERFSVSVQLVTKLAEELN